MLVKLEDKIQVENDMSDLGLGEIDLSKSLEDELKDLADVSIADLAKELTEKASLRKTKKRKTAILHPELTAEEFEDKCSEIRTALKDSNSKLNKDASLGVHHLVWFMRLINEVGYKVDASLLTNPALYNETLGSISQAGITMPLCDAVLNCAISFYKLDNIITAIIEPVKKHIAAEEDGSTASPRWATW